MPAVQRQHTAAHVSRLGGYCYLMKLCFVEQRASSSLERMWELQMGEIVSYVAPGYLSIRPGKGETIAFFKF